MNRPFGNALFAAVGLFLPGCVPLFYAYPSLSCTLPANVGPNRDQIYAFRVDVADERGCCCFTGPGRYSLCQLHIPPEGNLPGQARVAVDRGFLWLGPLTHQEHTRNTVRVRLYRPGYELVEIKSWKFGQPIEWKEAGDPRDEEKAVDGLVRATGAGEGSLQSLHNVFAHLEPGSVSLEHRHALLFVATEYERLGRALDLEPGKREALEGKAKALRELADR